MSGSHTGSPTGATTGTSTGNSAGSNAGSGTGSLDADLGIGEAAARAGVSTATMRFYEDKGLISSTRNEIGQRRYARDVLRRLAFIRAAQSVGLELAEIADALSPLPSDRAPTTEEWAAIAEEWRPRLDAAIATMEAMRDKLSQCIGCGCQTLDSCQIFNPDDKASEDGPGNNYLMPKVRANRSKRGSGSRR